MFGTDFDAPDGSAIRDNIHTADLANAHVLAAERLRTLPPTAEVYNLGTSGDTSVPELDVAVRAATGRDLPVDLARRRAGDPAILVADAAPAAAVLGWTPLQSSIETMMETALRWRLRH